MGSDHRNPVADETSARSGGVPTLTIGAHGPGASIESAIEVAEATKKLLGAVADEMGAEGLEWRIGSVQFKCDGCGLLRPDRPRPDEGWTYADGDDLCPSCTATRATGTVATPKDALPADRLEKP